MVTAVEQMSPAQQRAFNAEQGYAIFPALLTPAEVSALQAALDSGMQEAIGLAESNEKFSVTPGDDGKHYARRLYSPIQHHPLFYDMASIVPLPGKIHDPRQRDG